MTDGSPPNQPARLSSFDPLVDPLIKTMTLHEKLGQMTQVDVDALSSDEDVATYFLGSVLRGGGTDTPSNSREEFADSYLRLQRQALKTQTRIPLLYGVDAVHGHNNVVGAVRRILRVKAAMGLLEKGWSPAIAQSDIDRFGLTAHRELARRAVRQSVVLLKNAGAVLPAATGGRRVVVAGRSAHDIGRQSGGWTITWQGVEGPVTKGTTILEGIRQAAPDRSVTYAADGTGAKDHDLAIVVIGEAPYAEMRGDRATLALDAIDVDTVMRVKATGVPTVVVLVSGRPLWLEPILPHADAIVAAWLPGSEGQGVADVLFGRHPFTGKLPIAWPRASAREGSSSELAGAAAPASGPLFPFGFGLTR